MISDAAAGKLDARSQFAARYESVIRAYLGHRWRSGPLLDQLDDAVQEFFIECFRERGALDRVDPDRGDFRPFLYGVALNVARRHENRFRRHGQHSPIHPEVNGPAADDPTQSQAFDRAWLDVMLGRAVELMVARSSGKKAERARVRILQLRFGQDRSYRDIAQDLGIDPAEIYRQAAVARDEFKSALLEALKEHNPRHSGTIERECEDLLALL